MLRFGDITRLYRIVDGKSLFRDADLSDLTRMCLEMSLADWTGEMILAYFDTRNTL